jgi:hypothetical protein
MPCTISPTSAGRCRSWPACCGLAVVSSSKSRISIGVAVKFVALAEKLALMRSHFLYPHEIGRELAALGLRMQIHTEGHTAWVVAEKG